MTSLMLESIYAEHDGKRPPIIVDLGYRHDSETPKRWEAILATGVSRRNGSVEGYGRVMVRLPPKKAAAVLAALPIVAGETYWRSTHHWQGLAKGEATAPV